MAQEKPNLILNWIFDIPNQRLYTKISDDLEYQALEGGTLGYTKTYKGEVSHVTPNEWDFIEKFWISENYGETHGYYERNHELAVQHPERPWVQGCLNGLGKDGEYVDHLQRSQYILEGHDCATIWMSDWQTSSDPTFNLYATPDKGLTVFVRRGYSDVLYSEVKDNPDWKWVMHPQPCMMQPRSKSYQLSSHAELEEAGCPSDVVEKCKNGEWDSPLRPELQQHYIYPKA